MKTAKPPPGSKAPPWVDLLKLDRSAHTPLQRQIYERIRTAIDRRMLHPGDRVASARALASELGVARGTVESAYQRLMGEGYLVARGQAGTVVSPQLPHEAPYAPVLRSAKVVQPLKAFVPAAAPLPFQLGIPALDVFPRKLWSRIASRRIRATSAADLFYGDPAGYAPLRQAIAAYLLVSRGIACRADQVFVTAGYRASLASIAQTLLGKDDRAWIENPGYLPTRDVLLRAGCKIALIPVDHDGLVVDHGMRRAPHAKLAVVTPSHQAPLGVSMTMARRLQLLDWAARADAWIVEDDYDGEYRYRGPPLPALKSLDAHDRVLYAGSFSKTLYPGLALGYVVAPERLTDRYRDTVHALSNGCPQITQAIVADFMTEGHFSRHLKKMRLLYERRRALLATGLLDAFDGRVSVELQAGGMHLIARFAKAAESDRILAAKAQQAGLNCQPLSARYENDKREIANPDKQGLLLGFTNIASAADAKRLCARLKKAIA